MFAPKLWVLSAFGFLALLTLVFCPWWQDGNQLLWPFPNGPQKYPKSKKIHSKSGPCLLVQPM